MVKALGTLLHASLGLDSALDSPESSVSAVFFRHSHLVIDPLPTHYPPFFSDTQIISKP